MTKKKWVQCIVKDVGGHTKCNKDITGERVRFLEDKWEQKEKGFVERK